MAELIRYTTPAERARGCRFADKFQSQAFVEANNGSVTGSPTFSITEGVTLNGTNDYLTYNLTGREFYSDPISIVIEFNPDFAAGASAKSAFLFSGDDGYFVWKVDGSNVLGIDLGGTLIAAIPLVDYGQYWNVGERNCLVISGTSGDTSVWLNDNLILDSDASAWSPATNTSIHVGSNKVGGSPFDGTIHSFQVYHAKLTEQEASDFYTQDIYKYWNEATAIWPMTMAAHDPANDRTLDVSGNGYYLTDVSDPVKLATRGYRFDGANDYFYRTHDGTFAPAGDFSVLGIFCADNTSDNNIIGKWNAGTDNRCWTIHTSASVSLFTSSDGSNNASKSVANVVVPGKKIFFAATYDNSETLASVYVDDRTPVTGSLLVPYTGSNANLTVAALAPSSSKLDGCVYYLAYWDKLLTSLQIHDARITLMKAINDV